jgi:hypothetical protein
MDVNPFARVVGRLVCDADENGKIENAILTRARQLRIDVIG